MVSIAIGCFTGAAKKKTSFFMNIEFLEALTNQSEEYKQKNSLRFCIAIKFVVYFMTNTTGGIFCIQKLGGAVAFG